VAREIFALAHEADPGPPAVYNIEFCWGYGDTQSLRQAAAQELYERSVGNAPEITQSAVDTLGFGDGVPPGKTPADYEVVDGVVQEKV